MIGPGTFFRKPWQLLPIFQVLRRVEFLPRKIGSPTCSARLLVRLVSTDNVCGPKTSGLVGPFDLQPLIDKTLAIVSDTRFGGESISTDVQRLPAEASKSLGELRTDVEKRRAKIKQRMRESRV
ncbi:MAG: hypothetical protein KatS3mg111_2028 [Pirellulaceae bacterium]|nr:MAG: hypothetical protein KatS3mg111_2028 [Pirellulaceae bacterium]